MAAPQPHESLAAPGSLDPSSSASEPREPPVGARATLKYLGPSFILVGSVVGSGEIILTTTLGASVGFVMLWWVLLSCWGKSIVQAELGRYTVSTGETALQAFNRLPGRISGRHGRVSWFIWFWLFSLVPTLIGGGGIYGVAGQAANNLATGIEPAAFTVLLAVSAALIVFHGTYTSLEHLMTFMVVTFTLITVGCAVALQLTPLALTADDLRAGLRLEFPAFAVAAALGAYGGTGVNASDGMAYTYWCKEKGYARHVGPRVAGDEWAQRAKGWIRVMQFDTLLTLAVLTMATLPFYMLGAGVLKRLGLSPAGADTIAVLSRMYTETLGGWAAALFLVGALTVLFSCMVSGLAGNARLFADALTILGWIPDDAAARRRAIGAFALGAPTVMTSAFFLVRNPVWMITLGGIMGALMMPLVAGATLYLRHTQIDRRIQPGRIADALLWVCSAVMVALGAYAVWRLLWV